MVECCIENYNDIIVEKNVDKRNAVVGDILTYSIAVINQGDLAVEDVVIIDALPPTLEFIAGSVVLGGQNLMDANIFTGVGIGSLNPGAIKMLTFKAKIIARPLDGCINNIAIVKYKGMNMENCAICARDAKSNTVGVKVDLAEIKVIKSANSKVVSREDIVEYTIRLINVGTVKAVNILLTDIIAEEDRIIEGSFKVNGIQTGIDIDIIPGVGKKIQGYVGSLMPNEETVITYKLQVMGVGCNCKGYLVNKAYVTFNYNLPGGICGEEKSEMDEEAVSEIKLGLSTFKQLSVDGYLVIPELKPDIEEVNSVTATADLVNCHVIETPILRSNEGQKLSGHKLIVKGMLNVIVEYTANVPLQSVHSAHYAVPFSTFVVLPVDYKIGSRLEVEFVIEDVYYKVLDIRTLFDNITVLANVKILCC